MSMMEQLLKGVKNMSEKMSDITRKVEKMRYILSSNCY